jgi:hypothetical protein
MVDNTKAWSGGGGQYSTGACVGEFRRGPLGKIFQVTAANYLDILGKPYPKTFIREADDMRPMEAIRQMAEALEEANYLNVVRVIADDALRPVMFVWDSGKQDPKKIIDVHYGVDGTYAFKGDWDTLVVEYVVGDIVDVADGRLICVTDHEPGAVAPTVATPGAEWEEYTGAFLGDWVTAVGYLVDDIVRIDDELWLRCKLAHTSATAPTEEVLGNWSIYTGNHRGEWRTKQTYLVGDIVKVSDGYLRCKLEHVADQTAPTVASLPADEWLEFTQDPTAYKGGWLPNVAYIIDDIIDVADGMLRCTTAHTSSSLSTPTVATPGTNWAAFDGRFLGDYSNGLYHVDDVVSVGSALYRCKTTHVPALASIPGANWETYTGGNVKGDWAVETDYRLYDIVDVEDNGRLLCVVPHTSSDDPLDEPTEADPGDNFVVYTGVAMIFPWASGASYEVNNVVSVADGELVCKNFHVSSGTAPTVASHSDDWEEWEEITFWEPGIDYAVNDVILADGGSGVRSIYCRNAHASQGETAPLSTNGSFMWAVRVGNWRKAQAYKVNDIVTVSDGKLRCVANHTSGTWDPHSIETFLDTKWALWTSPHWCRTYAHSTIFTIGEGVVFVIYPIDGDPCTTRSFSVTDVDYVGHRFTLTLYDIDDAGQDVILGSYTVGIGEDDLDDFGRPCFIESVLEGQSDQFRAIMNLDVDFSAIRPIRRATFTGGTNGSAPTTADYIAAWDLFRDESVSAHLMFAPGCYDIDILDNCKHIANLRHTSFFFDAPPYMVSGDAIDWSHDEDDVKLLTSRQIAAYYCPYAASDPFFDGKTTWGASGAVVAACCKGNSDHRRGTVPGIHCAPAGPVRGTINRTGIVPLYPSDQINRTLLYNERINPVIVDPASKKLVIDDTVSRHFAANYSRFIWVNRIANYIDHMFMAMATNLKFEPDGLTRRKLELGTKRILDHLVLSGALVMPREAGGGTSPYSITVEQVEIDLWKVTWDFCPVGAARRIAGQPRIIR